MGSTQENLQAAFAGESQANRRYLYFAEQAEKEGHPQIARLFRAVAEAETVHARNHLGVLGGIGLDVYPQEGALADCLRAGKAVEISTGQIILELAKSDQVLFTPHNAFNTTEALEKKASLSAASIVSYLKNGAFTFSVPVS